MEEEISNTENIKVIKNFDEFNLDDNLLRGIYSYGFENPSQIQKTAILPIIEKKDVIAQAPSGTGKTGAFTISSLQRINTKSNTTQVLILAPTHELVKQISSVISGISNHIEGLRTKVLVGGTSVVEDSFELKMSVPHIIVGSVGRVADMIRRKNINTKDIQLFILDEADEMLSGGFLDNIYQIFTTLSPTIQVGIFSATLPLSLIHI